MHFRQRRRFANQMTLPLGLFSFPFLIPFWRTKAVGAVS